MKKTNRKDPFRAFTIERRNARKAKQITLRAEGAFV